MPQPNTISAAATATGQSVKRTYNYVEKLLEAELLEVSSNSGASIILRHTSSQTVNSRLLGGFEPCATRGSGFALSFEWLLLLDVFEVFGA